MVLCLNWSDNRLQNLNFSLDGSINQSFYFEEIKLTKIDSFWKPNLYFRNALSSKIINALINFDYIQIWPEKKLIKHCTRMSAQFICHMKLSNFPFDEHYCRFELKSCKFIAL